MADPIRTWPDLRDFAVGLGLPKVEDAVSWGNPNLKAHGKTWCWWSRYIDAAILKGSIEERDMQRDAHPETFLYHDHYRRFDCLHLAAGRIERDWAEARLRRTWADKAPKRWLAKWQAGEA